MLEVNLVPKHGNAARHFPHTGYFGVTPVVLTGSCHTRVPHLAEDIPVRSVHVLVRCYEIREGGPLSSSRENVLWEKRRLLWRPPAGVDEAPLGDWESPFKLVVPPEAADHAMGTQWLREWRVGWRLEVIVEHKPIPYVGHRVSRAFALDLHDHRSPPVSLPSPTEGMVLGTGSTTTHVFINPPPDFYGPEDSFRVSVSARPEDPTTVVRRMQIFLERRLEIVDDKGSSPPSRQQPQASRGHSPSALVDEVCSPPQKSRISSIFQRGLSPRPNYNRLSHSPSNSDGDSPAPVPVTTRVIIQRVAEVLCDIQSPGTGGMCWSLSTLSLPKRGGRWDTGETCRSELASISFDLRVKVTLKTAKPKSTLKEIISPPVPVTIVGSTVAERAAALAAATALMEARAETALAASDRPTSPGHLTKRKYRSSRRGLYMQEGTVDISSDLSLANRRRTRSVDELSALPLPNITGIATDIKPILLKADHEAQTNSIQFVFPSPASLHPDVEDDDAVETDDEHVIDAILSPLSPSSSLSGSRVNLPPLQSILYPYATPAASHTQSPKAISPPPGLPDVSPLAVDYDSLAILRRFQSTGRRISTTTSEEEEAQPLRTRPKLRAASNESFIGFGARPGSAPDAPPVPPRHHHRPPPPNIRPSLPSLDALGLGLPQLPDEGRLPLRRRPRTAPTFGVYSAYRPVPPPPLSGAIGEERPQSSDGKGAGDVSFAFAVPGH